MHTLLIIFYFLLLLNKNSVYLGKVWMGLSPGKYQQKQTYVIKTTAM